MPNTWSATIVDYNKKNADLYVGVSFTNGVTTFTESVYATGLGLSDVALRVQNILTALNSNDTLANVVAASVVTGIPVATIPLPPPQTSITSGPVA
jgi:hypothetical protein